MAKQITLFDFSSFKLERNAQRREEEKREAEEPKEETQRRRRESNWLKEAEEGRTYYLVSVDYDGKKGKAVCKLYDPEKQEVRILYDNTGHKSYFLVDLDPEQVRQIPKIIKDPSFDHLEVVYKIDPYSQKKIRLTKIVVKDPLAVRRMRNHVPRAYEAHIKYYNNYIYDMGLIPGMPYVVKKGRLEPVKIDVNVDEVVQAFADADEMTKETALSWAPLFESEVPPIKRAAIDIEVYTPAMGRVPDPVKAEFPIISISIAGTDGTKLVLLIKRPDVGEGNVNNEGVLVEEFETEEELLRRFFDLVTKFPLILTFNGDDFDIPYIIFRALKLGLFPEEIPFDLGNRETKFSAGFHIDLYKFFFNKAVRNYAFEGKYSEYNLDAVASALLGISKIKVDSISELSLSKLVQYNFRDSEITLKLTTFNNDLVWKLIILFSRISKLGIEELTRTEISAWVKNLYYWEHRQRNWLIPLKEEILERASKLKTAATIKGKGYKGAVVINPPVGVFFNVTVLDFASLYPSIIRNWNLSYETVDPEECKKIVEVKDETGEVLHTVCMERPGITAVITGLLRDFRVKIYKKKAKHSNLDQERKMLYDVVQRGMKVFINATYGVFGAETFPLYAPAVAESVTALGRYVITSTVTKARELGLTVLYGDTDSLFIYQPTKEKLEEIVKWVKQNFNLDLELDKSYKFVAFSGLKKNYFGVFTDNSVDIKGMLVKKRNTPEFLKESFKEVKDLMLKINSPSDLENVKKEIKEKVKEVYTRLKNKGYNLDQLAFRVMLSRDIDSYTKNTPQHVKAAALLRNFGIQVLPRDIILFVKVKSKDGVKPVQLAKLSEVDVDKYYDAVRSTFEQLLKSLGISWDEIASTISIDSFFK
ncbi:MAG: DNA polymerase I [Candidatus Aramenus sulfurataquae]|uniref:DNA polymerase n=2 Tax=Candidatus Aramenus sulfurataquae TaxID=1326980 RepID=W7KYY1_9CREN|nr:MAG: DNA polymerase I [Candidatus Aramenus sulfurataquae]MCL7343160.1 DNA-directed DNA polymerase I [Candidatus Aramenus sulfurataquae]